jgi:hypothetical protein
MLDHWSQNMQLIGSLSVSLSIQNFLISNFRHVLNVVFFLLDDSPASEFYALHLTIQTPGNHLKERIQ